MKSTNSPVPLKIAWPFVITLTVASLTGNYLTNLNIRLHESSLILQLGFDPRKMLTVQPSEMSAHNSQSAEWTFLAIVSTIALGAACYWAFSLVSEVNSESRKTKLEWGLRGAFLVVAGIYGAGTTKYHPAIAFLACEAAFIAIEHLQALASTNSMVAGVRDAAKELRKQGEQFDTRVQELKAEADIVAHNVGELKTQLSTFNDQSAALQQELKLQLDGFKEGVIKLQDNVRDLLNRHGVTRWQAVLHKYYVSNYAVRGTIQYWDWQLPLHQDVDLVQRLKSILLEEKNVDDLREEVRQVLAESHLRYYTINKTLDRFPDYATSCFITRLARLIIHFPEQSFQPIHIYASSPIINGELSASLPLYNYRGYNETDCYLNFIGCCAQTYFIGEFNALLSIATAKGLLAKEQIGTYRNVNVSKIKFDLVTSPPWHYTVSSAKQEEESHFGFVTQLFRSSHSEDFAVDLTAEENVGGTPFEPTNHSETLALFDDALQRLELESVPLETYLVSAELYYRLFNAFPQGIEKNSINEEVGARFCAPWNIDDWDAKTYYCRRVRQDYLNQQAKIGLNKVPGISRDEDQDRSLIKRTL